MATELLQDQEIFNLNSAGIQEAESSLSSYGNSLEEIVKNNLRRIHCANGGGYVDLITDEEDNEEGLLGVISNLVQSFGQEVINEENEEIRSEVNAAESSDSPNVPGKFQELTELPESSNDLLSDIAVIINKDTSITENSKPGIVTCQKDVKGAGREVALNQLSSDTACSFKPELQHSQQQYKFSTESFSLSATPEMQRTSPVCKEHSRPQDSPNSEKYVISYEATNPLKTRTLKSGRPELMPSVEESISEKSQAVNSCADFDWNEQNRQLFSSKPLGRSNRASEKNRRPQLTGILEDDVDVDGETEESKADDSGELCCLSYDEKLATSFLDLQLSPEEDSELFEKGQRGRPPRRKVDKPIVPCRIEPRVSTHVTVQSAQMFTAPWPSLQNTQLTVTSAVSQSGMGMVTQRFPVVLHDGHLKVCPQAQVQCLALSSRMSCSSSVSSSASRASMASKDTTGNLGSSQTEWEQDRSAQTQFTNEAHSRPAQVDTGQLRLSNHSLEIDGPVRHHSSINQPWQRDRNSNWPIRQGQQGLQTESVLQELHRMQTQQPNYIAAPCSQFYYQQPYCSNAQNLIGNAAAQTEPTTQLYFSTEFENSNSRNHQISQQGMFHLGTQVYQVQQSQLPYQSQTRTQIVPDQFLLQTASAYKNIDPDFSMTSPLQPAAVSTPIVSCADPFQIAAQGASTYEIRQPHLVGQHPARRHLLSTSEMTDHSGAGKSQVLPKSSASHSSTRSSKGPDIPVPRIRTKARVEDWLQNNKHFIPDLDSGTFDPSDHSLIPEPSLPQPAQRLQHRVDNKAAGCHDQVEVIGLWGSPVVMAPPLPHKGSKRSSGPKAEKRQGQNASFSNSSAMSESSQSSVLTDSGDKLAERKLNQNLKGSGRPFCAELAGHCLVPQGASNSKIQPNWISPVGSNRLQIDNMADINCSIFENLNETDKADLIIDQDVRLLEQRSLQKYLEGLGSSVPSTEFWREEVRYWNWVNKDLSNNSPKNNGDLSMQSNIDHNGSIKRSSFEASKYITPSDIESLEKTKKQNGKSSFDNYFEQKKNSTDGKSSSFSALSYVSDSKPLAVISAGDVEHVINGVNYDTRPVSGATCDNQPQTAVRQKAIKRRPADTYEQSVIQPASQHVLPSNHQVNESLVAPPTCVPSAMPGFTPQTQNNRLNITSRNLNITSVSDTKSNRGVSSFTITGPHYPQQLSGQNFKQSLLVPLDGSSADMNSKALPLHAAHVGHAPSVVAAGSMDHGLDASANLAASMGRSLDTSVQLASSINHWVQSQNEQLNLAQMRRASDVEMSSSDQYPACGSISTGQSVGAAHTSAFVASAQMTPIIANSTQPLSHLFGHSFFNTETMFKRPQNVGETYYREASPKLGSMYHLNTADSDASMSSDTCLSNVVAGDNIAPPIWLLQEQQQQQQQSGNIVTQQLSQNQHQYEYPTLEHQQKVKLNKQTPTYSNSQLTAQSQLQTCQNQELKLPEVQVIHQATPEKPLHNQLASAAFTKGSGSTLNPTTLLFNYVPVSESYQTECIPQNQHSYPRQTIQSVQVKEGVYEKSTLSNSLRAALATQNLLPVVPVSACQQFPATQGLVVPNSGAVLSQSVHHQNILMTPDTPSVPSFPVGSAQDFRSPTEGQLRHILSEGFPSLGSNEFSQDIFSFLQQHFSSGSSPEKHSQQSMTGKEEFVNSSDKMFQEQQSVMSRTEEDSDLSVYTVGSEVDVPSVSLQPDSDGETLLHVLCVIPKAERHKVLSVSSNPGFTAALNMLNKNQETPLLVAVKHQDVEIVQYLMSQGADPNILCLSSPPSGKPRAAGMVLRENKVQQTALHEAVELGNLEIVKLLLTSTRINVDIKRPDTGLTPLMLALQLHKVFDQREIILHLIKKHASLFVCDTVQEKTPLMFAIQSGDVALVEQILQQVGAEQARALVSARAKKDMTCLHYAADLRLDPVLRQRLLRCIIVAGGDPSAKNSEGESPRDWAKADINNVLSRLSSS